MSIYQVIFFDPQRTRSTSAGAEHTLHRAGCGHIERAVRQTGSGLCAIGEEFEAETPEIAVASLEGDGTVGDVDIAPCAR
jgi:hypothetical protein